MGAAPATRIGCIQKQWESGYDACADDLARGTPGAQRSIWCSGDNHSVYCPCHPAQPDARDAEIARLTKECDEWREAAQRTARALGFYGDGPDGGLVLSWSDRWDEKAADVVADVRRLTKELEEARAAHQETRDERDTIKDEFDQLALAHYGSEAKALLEALRDLFWDNFPRGVLITRAVCTAPEWRAYQLLAPPEPKAETPAETHAKAATRGALDARWIDGWMAGRDDAALVAVQHDHFYTAEKIRLCSAPNPPPPAETAGQKEGR